jgi:lipoprotein NlpI
MADDLRLEQEMLKGLVDRIRIKARDYPRFSMGGMTIVPAQVVDAGMDRITVVGGGMRAGYPWSSVEPRQFIQLLRDYWPDIDGKPALGLAFWARRHRLDATSKAPPTSAESLDTQYFKLLHEGERALSDGDLSVARDRFGKAYLAGKDGKEARDGLDRVAAAERKKAADAAPVKPAVKAPDPDPEPVRILENPKLAEEHHQKGEQLFDAGQYRDAIDEYTQAIAYAKEKGNAYAMRAHARYLLGEWEGARGDFRASVAVGAWSDDYSQLYLWLIGARLGQKDAATKALRSHTLNRSDAADAHAAWFRSLSKYLTKDLEEDQLVRLSAEESGQMKRVEKECEAFFYIGTRNLLEGNRTAARQWFKKSLLTGVAKYLEYKGATEELDRLGPAVVAEPAPQPAAVRAPVMPPPPALASNEKLILTAPEGIQWQLLSIGPDGSSAAYKELQNGKASLVWKQGRLEGLDRIEDICVWKDGRTPVVKVWIGGKVHVAEGSTLYEPWVSATDPIISPNRQSVAYIARDGSKTFVIAHGKKSEALEITDNSLSYTPQNQIFYYATVPTVPEGRMTSGFLDRNARGALGPYDGTREGPPTFSEDGTHVAYPLGDQLILDSVGFGPSFRKVSSPRFSGDSKVIAYFAEIGIGANKAPPIKKLIVVGGNSGNRFDDVAGAPVLSRDGKVVAYIAKKDGKWVVVQGTRPGESYDSIPPRRFDIDQPVMTPDGKVVAYTAERGNVLSLVVNGKEVDSQPHMSAPSISADGKSVSFGFVTGPYFIWKTLPLAGR